MSSALAWDQGHEKKAEYKGGTTTALIATETAVVAKVEAEQKRRREKDRPGSYCAGPQDKTHARWVDII